MKFMLLLHDDEAAWFEMSEAEQGEVIAQHTAYSQALEKAGVMTGGEPLDAAASAKVVRGASVQDGPYADTKEQLGGFYVIEAADMDAAIGWAKQCPISPAGAVEVRPIPNLDG